MGSLGVMGLSPTMLDVLLTLAYMAEIPHVGLKRMNMENPICGHIYK